MEVPAEVCRKEGFAEETPVSLILKDGEIQTSFVHPAEKARQSAGRFTGKYGEFMKEMQEIDG